MVGSSSRETNYWPGFVDALSNMVLAMVFVVLVLSLAISMYAAMAAKATAERIASERVAAAELRAALAVAKQEAAARSAPSGGSDLPGTPRVLVPGRTKSEGVPGARLERRQNALIVEFEGSSVAIDERTAKALDQALAPAKDLLRSGSADIVATAPAGYLTESRQVSFYRAMAVRNFLIERGMAANRINVRVLEDSSAGERGEVRVAFRASLAGAAP